MESTPSGFVHVASDGNSGDLVKDRNWEELLSQVDPFLVESLGSPRHRLNVLHMELDIQGFMRNPNQHQFEFEHFPTSYLRCAAHRVTQHYGLQTMVLDITSDGSGRIVVWKTPESKFPAMCLSEIPAKQSESFKFDQVKIVLRHRPSKVSQNDADQPGTNHSPVRSVEERKEDYDRARARIFSNYSISELEGAVSHVIADGRNLCSNADELECQKSSVEDPEKMTTKDGSSRIAAIFRDREKDKTDPDYDRSYDRYARGMPPNQTFNLDQYSLVQTPFMQYEAGFTQLGQLPRICQSLNYPLPNQILNPYYPTGCNHNSTDAVNMQWPSPTMMYAQSYEHFRHTSFQVPFYQQPLSFGSSQKR